MKRFRPSTTLRMPLAALILLAAGLPPARAQTPEPAAEAVLAAASVPETAMLLRLYDGGMLWGEIAGHEAESLSFRRLDTGGLVRLGWARLDPVQAEELLERFGYVDDTSDEVMIEADRLILADGRELIGKIVNRTENEIWVKTATSTVPVPKMRLRAAATVVQVPALDVYTREELYRQELGNLDPNDPASHVELALFCERVFAFEEGIGHLEAAGELDAEHQPEVLANHLGRLREKHANQEQIEVLREVDHLRARGKFDQALLLTSTFSERFPDSPLLGDAMRKQKGVERSLEKALNDRVARLWHHWSRKLVRRTAMDPEMTFEAAVGWVDEALSEEILTKVHEELSRTVSADLTPEQIREYWDKREHGRWQKSSYGEGTWLLGQGDALAGLDVPAAKKETMSEREAERERLAERIRRYMKNQEVIRRAKSGGSASDDGDQQEFWGRWTSNGRSGWLLAHYAENGGDMQLREATFRNCTQCGGSGMREVINTGSARTNTRTNSGAGSADSGVISCPTCRNIGKWRTIAFR